MRIRFIHPATARLAFQPGDTIIVDRVTPELQALLDSKRIDNQPVCVLAHDAPTEEIADAVDGIETAVVGSGGGRRRSGGR